MQLRKGKLMLSDGPFADFQGKIAVYELIECASLK